MAGKNTKKGQKIMLPLELECKCSIAGASLKYFQ